MTIDEFRNAFRKLLSDAALSIPVEDIMVAAEEEINPALDDISDTESATRGGNR